MHRYYDYNKYFVNKLTTISLYQKSFINNMVNKIKCIYQFNYKIGIDSQRKTMLTLTSFRRTLRNKLCMKTINYACFKLEEKITRHVKNNKSNFINTKGDKFTMSRVWLTWSSFVIHNKIKIYKSLELSIDLWHLNNMKDILTLWTLNYVDYVPFSCIISLLFTIKPIHLKNVYDWIHNKHVQTFNNVTN